MVLALSIITLAIDQITKYFAVKHLKGNGPIKIIHDFFNLYYIENRGAAFGILSGGRGLFIVITVVILIILVIFIYKYYDKFNLFKKITFGLLIGGALGNFIDRVKLGYVIDFLSFRLFNSYNFPVFNFADVFVVIATIMMILILFFDEEFLKED